LNSNKAWLNNKNHYLNNARAKGMGPVEMEYLDNTILLQFFSNKKDDLNKI
jgi:hypothetical protein